MTTSLFQSSFWLLGASVHDDRRRIVELIEEKSFDLDNEVCQRIRADLTQPRSRISQEVAWLPGLPHGQAAILMQTLHDTPATAYEQMDISTLARANILAAALALETSTISNSQLADLILALAVKAEQINADDVLALINADRSVSGFSEVRDIEHIEEELRQRSRYYRSVIKDQLNQRATLALVDTINLAARKATANGAQHAPVVIVALLDSYETELQGFIQDESDNVRQLIDTITTLAPVGSEVIEPLVTRLEDVLANWTSMTQALQLNAKARGTQHDPSRDLALSIRGLAVDLYNNHDLDQISHRLTLMLQQMFSAIPDIAERVTEDVTFFAQKKITSQTKTLNPERLAQILFRREIGFWFKKTLSISSTGVSWNGQNFPLTSITRVRWGGESRNNVSTYTVAFGDNLREAVFVTQDKRIFTEFCDCLWRAVGLQLKVNMAKVLATSKTIPFADAILHDKGITLVKHKLFGTEKVFCRWSEIELYSQQGVLKIMKASQKDVYVDLPYQTCANVVALEQLIEVVQQKGVQRISDLS